MQCIILCIVIIIIRIQLRHYYCLLRFVAFLVAADPADDDELPMLRRYLRERGREGKRERDTKINKS